MQNSNPTPEMDQLERPTEENVLADVLSEQPAEEGRQNDDPSMMDQLERSVEGELSSEQRPAMDQLKRLVEKLSEQHGPITVEWDDSVALIFSTSEFVRRDVYQACERNRWYRVSYHDPRSESRENQLKFKCQECDKWILCRNADKVRFDEDDGRVWSVKFKCHHCHEKSVLDWEDDAGTRIRHIQEPNCCVVLPSSNTAQLNRFIDELIVREIPVGGHALKKHSHARHMFQRQRTRWHSPDKP